MNSRIRQLNPHDFAIALLSKLAGLVATRGGTYSSPTSRDLEND